MMTLVMVSSGQLSWGQAGVANLAMLYRNPKESKQNKNAELLAALGVKKFNRNLLHNPCIHTIGPRLLVERDPVPATARAKAAEVNIEAGPHNNFAHQLELKESVRLLSPGVPDRPTDNTRPLCHRSCPPGPPERRLGAFRLARGAFRLAWGGVPAGLEEEEEE